MTLNKKLLVLAFIFAAFAFVSDGSAQYADPGNVGLADPNDDYDSYWLDNRVWLFYGFRPHTTKATRFEPSLPTWATGKQGYSFGMNQSPSDKPWYGTSAEYPVQLPKAGTWH